MMEYFCCVPNALYLAWDIIHDILYYLTFPLARNVESTLTCAKLAAPGLISKLWPMLLTNGIFGPLSRISLKSVLLEIMLSSYSLWVL